MTLSLFAAASGACTAEPPEPAADFRPTATVQDIMSSMIDPAADALWDAVVTTVTADGVDRTVPRTDEDWAYLRRNAITLVEATNLLLIDGRRIARAGARSALPGIDLEPEEIESLVARDRATWIELAQGLHDTGLAALDAVDAKDADALLAAGGSLDAACESCHSRYWYPGYGDPRADAPGR